MTLRGTNAPSVPYQLSLYVVDLSVPVTIKYYYGRKQIRPAGEAETRLVNFSSKIYLWSLNLTRYLTLVTGLQNTLNTVTKLVQEVQYGHRYNLMFVFCLAGIRLTGFDSQDALIN